MRKLSRLLLIHWYTYEKELIEFDTLNFLTGKTAAGKSTIIDALQLVLLGNTNGNFFNKAANEKSVRTLKSYLYGENGDDGDTGFRYLRQGPFTSYVVAEFEDTQKKTCFLNGIICDCHADQVFDHKWFTVDRFSLPESHFLNENTGVPLDIPGLKNYLKQYAKSRYEIIDSNARYQNVLLGRYGSVKHKYLTLLKKAVPFSPITDIEKFITESVCDVKNNIQVEQMQSDIRQYKNLEAEAVRTKKRIDDLSVVSEITKQYETEKDRYKQQSYVILRAQQQEYEEIRDEMKREVGKRSDAISKAESSLEQNRIAQDTLQQETEKLETEYHTSDILKKQTSLEESIRKQRQEIDRIRAQRSSAHKALRDYSGGWLNQLKKASETGFIPAEEDLQLLMDVPRMTEEELDRTDYLRAGKAMEHLHEQATEYEYEVKHRSVQIRESLTDLEARIQNLEKGIKPYPAQVTGLKRALEKGLFEQFGKAVDIPVFADLLEIRDQVWRNALEGYLDKQKFNLLVPEQYFQAALQIYNAIRREERIYDTGIVDIGKLRRKAGMIQEKPKTEHSSIRAEKGSLAEEIETEHADARLYADYLLGRVMKCDHVKDLKRYPVAITRDVMLYKGYVSRRLNPARYANPFIGRRSLQIQLEQLRLEHRNIQQEYEELLNSYRLVKNVTACPVMSLFEAQQHQEAMGQVSLLPSLLTKLDELQTEYEGIDFSWLDQLKVRIAANKGELRKLTDEMGDLREIIARADAERSRYVEKDIPDVEEQLQKIRSRISTEFEEDWIRENGEPKYLKEIARERRGQMSMRESFERARTQTQTQMDNHRKERTRKRSEYNQEYQMPFDVEREDNNDYDKELHTLSDIRLPQYIDQIVDAKEKAYNQFRDDFIAKLKSNIESVREQIEELNYSLKNSVFGTDRYRFTINPRAEYRSYYDMITDPMLLDTGGWNITSEQFNKKYQQQIDSLFKALIINETEVSAERRAEYERNIRKFTDYKTYLVFDLIVTNDQGEEQRLSRTLLKKSGGETQIPFYISLLASFSQVCRIRSKNNNNTIRVIILDEAFSKMDGERIKESIQLLRRFGLQAIFSAPPDKIPDIAPDVDRNIAVFRNGHHSFTRYFDPKELREDLTETGMQE